MHYHWYSAESFYGMLEGNCPECWGQYIQPGINDGLLFTVGPGSYIFEEYNVWDNHDPIVEACRTIPWVDGFQFFSYGSWRDRTTGQVQAIVFQLEIKNQADPRQQPTSSYIPLSDTDSY